MILQGMSDGFFDYNAIASTWPSMVVNRYATKKLHSSTTGEKAWYRANKMVYGRSKGIMSYKIPYLTVGFITGGLTQAVARVGLAAQVESTPARIAAIFSPEIATTLGCLVKTVYTRRKESKSLH